MGPPGHIAFAFAAKPLVRSIPLWVLIVATLVLDILSFAFLAMGLERTAPDPWLPWSHGLVMSTAWSLALGLVAYLVSRDRRAGIVIGLLIFSHWAMDFLSHSRDLPILFARSPLLGLGLESSLAVGIVMEFTMLAIGVAIYVFSRKAKPAAGAPSES